MIFLKTTNSRSDNILSWEKSVINLHRIQKRLLKAVYVGDIKKVLFLQKIILYSNSSKLLSIREVTQVSSGKKISGVDGKTFLTFTERFELSEYIKQNVSNWYPQPVKSVSLLKKDGNSFVIKIPTISDRVWQCLVTFIIEPVNAALFHPHNVNFYSNESLFDLQKLVLLNIEKKSNGDQKRMLFVTLDKVFSDFNINNLLKKIIAPRGIKLGIFRLLKKGLTPGFFEDEKEMFRLNCILGNIILDGVEDLHYLIRCNSYFLFFLLPDDNEKIIVRKLSSFLQFSEIKLSVLDSKVYSTSNGFDFLDWRFRFSIDKGSYVTPSFVNYQKFLKRIKQIINNSNYGAVRVLYEYYSI